MSVAKTAHGCKCSINAHGKNAWENARQFADDSIGIFEGRPTKFDLQWSLLSAKEGELIPADISSSHLDYLREHNMAITFQVSRVYKGSVGSEVQIHTGLGGGDCGAVYAPGLSYLVYAGGANLDQLTVSMCSPGGWIDGSEVATDLRSLRKERPTSTDLTPIKRWSEKGWDKQEGQRRSVAEEWRKKYDAATGKICGSLIHRDSKDNRGASIAFLSTLGYSPFSPDYGQVKEDGSFCSGNLGPGKYYLYFVSASEESRSAVYYPGVTDFAKATPIEVRAGQTQSQVVFNAPPVSTSSVRRLISASEKPDFGNSVPSDIAVLLIRADGDRRVWYYEKAYFVSNLGYFRIKDVIPGRYYAFVQTPGPGWMTRKAVVDVTSHMRFISLDLVHKK